MTSLHALLLAVTLTGASDATLLDFHSPHCGPCQSMAPTISRLEKDGFAVRRIDVGEQPHVAQRYGVRAVPCFVMLADGREVDRVEGPTSYERLQQMYARAGVATPTGVANPAGIAQKDPSNPSAAMVQPARFRGQSPDPVAQNAAPRDLESLAQAALQATVRLRVEDDGGQSWGTGTIIDVHGSEALVVTCGHLFRESRGRGKITAELFTPGAKEPLPGELIAYDADERDIGLVSIRLDMPVQPVRVAAAGRQGAKGDRVFSIGCNHGEAPTIRHSHVTAVNKYVGPANIEVAGEPVDGRSGGGLFAADGTLIGICNAADPQDKEGIYAALDTIHWQLTEVGQSRVFDPQQAGPPPTRFAGPSGGERRGPAAATAIPNAVHNGSATSRSNDNRLADVLAAGNSDTEVICIVRRKDQPQGQVLVLDQLPPHLIQQLLDASRNQTASPQERGPIIRAQSQDNHPAYR
jgi:thiol-disulfide isomerase/thioredoxin